MRPLALAAILLLLAGCASPAEPDAPDEVESAPTTPTDDAASTAPAPQSEPIVASMERFVMLANMSLGVHRDGEPEMPVATVPHTLTATAFWESFVNVPAVQSWTSFPMRSAFETTGDVEIALSFSSTAAAVSSNPRAAGFPPVGMWLGTNERWEYFLLAADAPDTLEANKVYTVRVTAKSPQGGWFVREGESIAIYPFLSYQTADNSPLMFVVGGPEPAGFVLPHRHFNLSAPRATVLVDEAGELSPNPGPTGDMHREPAILSYSVPADAAYVVLEVTGAPKAGTRLDLDVSARTPSGEVIMAGTSPAANERTAIGPGNLAAYGRDLVAHVTCSACPSGATYSLKVTAYGP